MALQGAAGAAARRSLAIHNRSGRSRKHIGLGRDPHGPNCLFPDLHEI
jgi:hypothetical protein